MCLWSLKLICFLQKLFNFIKWINPHWLWDMRLRHVTASSSCETPVLSGKKKSTDGPLILSTDLSWNILNTAVIIRWKVLTCLLSEIQVVTVFWKGSAENKNSYIIKMVTLQNIWSTKCFLPSVAFKLHFKNQIFQRFIGQFLQTQSTCSHFNYTLAILQ